MVTSVFFKQCVPISPGKKITSQLISECLFSANNTIRQMCFWYQGPMWLSHQTATHTLWTVYILSRKIESNSSRWTIQIKHIIQSVVVSIVYTLLLVPPTVKNTSALLVPPIHELLAVMCPYEDNQLELESLITDIISARGHDSK